MKTFILSALALFSTSMSFAQTAVCQNATVYLDGAGNATITGADIDGGSMDDAMTGSLTLLPSQTTFSCADLAGTSGAGIIISGAYDGPLTGGVPKGVELFVTGDITDLSEFGIGSANNGGGTDGEEFTFPADSYVAGDFIYVTTDSAGFADFFGFNADYYSGSMSINGDDAVELFHNGAVTDVFGDINTDGSGQPWDYLDGWAYRNDFQTANGGVFDPVNWSFSGINVFDGQASNVTSPIPFLTGTFTPATAGAVAVTLVVEDGNSDQDSCVAFVTVLDTLAPTTICQDASVYIDAAGLALISENEIDNGSTDNCGIASMSTNIQTFTCTELGANSVTLMVIDNNGNSSTCVSTVTVIDTILPVATCQDLTIALDGSGLAIIDPSDIDGGSTDNCGVASLSTNIQTFTCDEIGANLVELTVVDADGNMDVCTATVTVTGPTLDLTTSVSGATITSNATGATYEWIDCSDNSIIAGETSNSYTATTNGDYAVIITDGCSDTSDCVSISTIGLEESLINIGLTIYPNPSNGNVAIETNDNISGTIMIMDANGRLIITDQIEGSKTMVNIEAIANGVYQVVVTTDKGIYRRRLIKE